MYTLRSDGSVTRDADGATIPAAPGNTDWQAYQAWRAGGNAPNPAPVVPVPVRRVTGTQLMAALVDLGIKGFFDQATTLTTKPLDAWYYRALTPNDLYPENNAKLGRLSTKAIALGVAAVPPVVFTLATVFDKAVTE